MTLSPASPNHDARIDKGSPDVEKSEKNPLDDVPDGGFLAWLQIAAAFFIFMNTAGLFNSFGVYQGFYSQGPLSSVSGSKIAWIGSLQGCLMLLICIVTGPLYDLGYLHSMVNVGTFAITFGMMMTSLCHEYWQFILAQGVVVGIGNGLLFLPSIAVVPQYFSTKKSLASGIVAAGSSVGMVLQRLPDIVIATADCCARIYYLPYHVYPSGEFNRISVGHTHDSFRHAGHFYRLRRWDKVTFKEVYREKKNFRYRILPGSSFRLLLSEHVFRLHGILRSIFLRGTLCHARMPYD